jgi:hypothetical protein
VGEAVVAAPQEGLEVIDDALEPLFELLANPPSGGPWRELREVAQTSKAWPNRQSG